MIYRRECVAGSMAVAVGWRGLARASAPESEVVNDVHSELNSTRGLEILQPRSVEDVQDIVRAARKNRQTISLAGGRHAMGGQRFGTILIDIRKMNRTIHLDREILTVESGIEWRQLIDEYLALQSGKNPLATLSESRSRVATHSSQSSCN
jgi:FAD/FMN-containing dehydrogenase